MIQDMVVPTHKFLLVKRIKQYIMSLAGILYMVSKGGNL